MNILIEAGDLNPPFVEGTRNIVKMHAKELVRRGHKVVFITRKRGIIDNKLHENFEVIEGISYYRWSNPLSLFFLLRKVVKKEEIDVIHIFAKGLRPKIYLDILKSTKKPIIFTLLGHPFQLGYKEKLFPSFLERINVLTITSRTVFEKLKGYGEKKIVHFPYGLDLTKYKRKHPSHKEHLKIISLRTSSIEVLKAFQKLQGELPSLKLILDKRQTNEKEKEFILKENLKKNILFVGLIEDVTSLLNPGSIMLELNPKGKPLLCASPPLLMLEGMILGERIVATDIPEIREVLGKDKAGILIKDNSEKEIYFGIQKALKKTPSKEAIKIINERYSVKKVIKSFERIYSLMDGGKEKND